MSRGTTARAVRVDERLWRAAQERAEAAGETVSDVIRRALGAYLAAPLHCVCSHDRQLHTAGDTHCTKCSCIAFDGRGIQSPASF